MIKQKFIIFTVIGFMLFLGIGLVFSFYSPFQKINTQSPEYIRFSPEITKYEAKIKELGCKSGEEIYLGLAQDYKYVKAFQSALNTYKDIKKCYPDVYGTSSEKAKTLLHNQGALYEDWAYYLKTEKQQTFQAKIKYKAAIKSFSELIKTFEKTNFLSFDEKKSYEHRIQQIELKL